MDRKGELELIIARARAELQNIKEAETAEINKTLVGKCFKYHRNRYSSSESWWHYSTVTEVSNDFDPLAFSFQKDSYGKIELENDIFRKSAGHIEISEQEFWEAYDGIMAELNARRPTKRQPAQT